MNQSEYLEWVEYISTVPDKNEIQMAMLLTIANGFMGGKRSFDDFMITKIGKTNKNRDISTASAADINKLAGV